MTGTIVASGWTGNNDGGGVGLSFTSPAGITATQKLLVGLGGSSNGDTFGAPGTGTWGEVALPDNVVTTSGGQYRLYECLNPASSTAYTFTMSATRRTLVWMLVDNVDTTGGTMVDVASSLESAAASTHAPPSVVPNAAAELVFDLMWFRQFNPDTSTGSPPATGLTWTELLDVRGLDVGGSGQNIQCNVNYATAGSSGVAISTAALNTDDPFEPALVMRVVLKNAAGGSDVNVPDTSGGAGGSGTPDAASQGVVLPDGSGGASGGSSASLAPVVGVTVPDTPGGASAGSSGSTVVQGVTLADASGGAGAGSSLDAVISDVVVPDPSGGATGGGSPDTPGAATFVPDASGGAGGGTTPDTVVQGVTLAGASGGASGGSSAGLVDVPSDVTIVDSSGGAGAGSSREVADVPTPTVVRDTMVMPVLLSALACLQDEAAKVEKPPALYTIRPGDSFEPSADPWTDECCVGIGWTRMVTSFETYDFPNPATVMEGNCPPHSWAVVIEVGINRCVPVAGDGRGSIVTSAQWLEAAQAQADDGAALRRTLCCLRALYDVADVTAGQVNPLPLQANCGGVVLQITVRRDACDCSDPTSH